MRMGVMSRSRQGLNPHRKFASCTGPRGWTESMRRVGKKRGISLIRGTGLRLKSSQRKTQLRVGALSAAAFFASWMDLK